MSNVVVTLYPAPVPGKTLPAANIGILTGGGAAITTSLGISGVTNVDYLFARITASYVSGAAPHDAWSDTMHMGLSDGGSTVYWPTNTPTLGGLNQDSTNTLIWSGQLPGALYHGGSNLTVKFLDTYNDPQGPYYSTVSNVVVTLYPAPVPGKTLPAANIGILTGGGAAITTSLNISGVTNVDYLFARITASYVSGAAPHDAWSDTMHMGLSDGGSTVYWPTNTPTLGGLNQDSTNTLIWSGQLPGGLYEGGGNLSVKFVDTYNDPQGPYYSTVSNVVVTLYPAVSSVVAPNAPQVTMLRSGSDLILTWPANATGFTLQSAANLASPAGWSNVSPTPVVINGQTTLTNALSNGAMFYRVTQ